eukprot:9279-Heterococcus_DN1.PRE.6
MRALVLLAVAASVVQTGADCSRREEVRVTRKCFENKQRVVAAHKDVLDAWRSAYVKMDSALAAADGNVLARNPTQRKATSIAIDKIKAAHVVEDNFKRMMQQ